MIMLIMKINYNVRDVHDFVCFSSKKLSKSNLKKYI